MTDDLGMSLFEQCATPMALVDAALVVHSINPGLRDWLAAGPRDWRGQTLAIVDAKPPALGDAAARALAGQGRVWLRNARLRSAIGDRTADVALTALDTQRLLLELQPAAAEPVHVRLSESLRGFAHEVKGPLAGMRGAAQLLQRRVAAGELRELAALIVAETDRLGTLSDRLLLVGAKPRLVRANVHEILERVAALLAAGRGGLAIRRDYDPSLPPLDVDADRLQQAFLNLGRNAIEAGAHTLTLRTRAEHAPRIGTCPTRPRLGVRIDVGDDGDGVAADLAQTLFEPLVSGRAGGSGLGLALAREIAHEHGGDLDYASRPGATVFTLRLPVNE